VKAKGLKIIGILLAIALLLTLALSVMDGCSPNSKSKNYSLTTKNTLTVAVSLDYPPFEYLEGDTPTGYSKEQVNFTTPYYFVDQAVVVLEGTYDTVDELAELPVVALTNSSSFDYATNSVSSRVVSRTSVQECFKALESGQARAVVTEYSVAKTLIESYADCEILERIATRDGYGIAVNKDNPALTEAINEALASMEEDGTLDSLQQQYL